MCPFLRNFSWFPHISLSFLDAGMCNEVDYVKKTQHFRWVELEAYHLKVAGEVHDVLSLFLYYGYLSFVLTVLQIVSYTGMIEVANLIFYFLRSLIDSAKIAVIWKSRGFHLYLSNQPHNRVKCYKKYIVINIHP